MHNITIPSVADYLFATRLSTFAVQPIQKEIYTVMVTVHGK